MDIFKKIEIIKNEKPYSQTDYDNAKELGFDLDDWNDYVKYFLIGEEEDLN